MVAAHTAQAQTEPARPGVFDRITAQIEAEEREALAAELTDHDPALPAALVKPSEFEPATIPIPRTGQTESRHAGDDGFHSRGQPWPDPRFADNGNGTVTDLLTGLVWLKDPSAFTPMAWTNALAVCNELATGQASLTDGSSPGDWRLPNVCELQSLLDFSKYDPALPPRNPFRNVASAIYWTSTTRLDSPQTPYSPPISYSTRAVNLTDGRLTHCQKADIAQVWPVRCLRPGPQGDPAPATPPPAPVPRTGQTRSFEIGDDGYHQKGRPWPAPRFTDNGNGTVTDNLTGLIWLRSNKLSGMGNWEKALTFCNELADGKARLTDGSAPGDWRLPNVRELQSLIDHSQRDPAIAAGHPFVNTSGSSHWTSTPLAHKDQAAHRVGIRDGGTGYSSTVGGDVIWPVRGGR